MRLLLALALMVVLAAPALAFSGNVGDRAADFHGWDVIHGRPAALSDFAGKWVFIDFWASWCGPCMGELPNLIAQTKDLRGRKDFAVFSVSLDEPDTLERMHKAIAEQGITYAVLYDGGGWKSVPAVEWGIHAIPATFLLDPAGNIVATNLRGETLRPALDFFLNHQGVYAPIGVRTSQTVNDDGSVAVRLELCNPRHAPLKVEVDYYHMRYTWAPDDPDHKNPPVNREYIEQDPDNPEMSFDVPAGDFGDMVHEFTIPAAENAQNMGYYVSVELPETEALMDGHGLWVSASGRAKLGK